MKRYEMIRELIIDAITLLAIVAIAYCGSILIWATM